MICPLCNTDMTEVYREVDRGILTELKYECPNDCYSYEFCYGSCAVQVGKYLTYELSASATMQEAKKMAEKVTSGIRSVRVATAYQNYTDRCKHTTKS